MLARCCKSTQRERRLTYKYPVGHEWDMSTLTRRRLFPIIPANERKLRFVDLAHGIEASLKVTRKMLQNPGLVLPGRSDEEATKRGYTPQEVGLLALTRRLVDFGFTIADASHMANEVFEGAALGSGSPVSDMTPDDLLNMFSGVWMTVCFEDGERAVRLMKADDPTAPFPDPFALNATATLVLPLGEIVLRALHRAFVGSAYRGLSTPVDLEAADAKLALAEADLKDAMADLTRQVA